MEWLKRSNTSIKNVKEDKQFSNFIPKLAGMSKISCRAILTVLHIFRKNTIFTTFDMLKQKHKYVFKCSRSPNSIIHNF